MKDSFHGYYPPNDEQYKRLWEDGLIVLDTNVLLNLYRLPTTARDELIGVLEQLKDRLWIPHQVALEFQRRRLTVIASERKSTEEALTFASDLVSEIKKKVDALQIEKRSLGIDSQPLLADLEKANSQLVDAIRTTHASQLDISASDPIRQRLDDLLHGRVGVPPISQTDLDGLVQDGDDRYKDKIPPGFADVDKEKNPNEAVFVFDHIRYQRKFGDLILWRQIIKHVKDTNCKTVLFITADRKEDWWWREQGQTIGPHPELIREIKREGAVNLFWMYSSVQFVKHANEYSTAKVSDESVAEIRQVARTSRENSANIQRMIGQPFQFDTGADERLEQRLPPSRQDMMFVEQGVERWLSRRGDTVEVNQRGFPDFLVRDGEDAYGYDLKYIRHFDRLLVSPAVINSILRGYMETKEGRLTGFTLIIAITEEDYLQILHSERKMDLLRRLGRLLRNYPVDSIVVGAMFGDNFEVLAQQAMPDKGEDDILF
jgi:hypothetical protein